MDKAVLVDEEVLGYFKLEGEPPGISWTDG